MFNLLDTSSSEDETVQNHVDNYRNQRIRRIVRPRINFSFMLTGSFKERFRVAPSVATNILNIIGPIISHRTLKNDALDARQQLLISLHFFGGGSQYHCVGDMHGIHASTVCRIINRVCRAIINTLFRSQVCWPHPDQSPVALFQIIGGFPNVAGNLNYIHIFTAPNDVIRRLS